MAERTWSLGSKLRSLFGGKSPDQKADDSAPEVQPQSNVQSEPETTSQTKASKVSKPEKVKREKVKAEQPEPELPEPKRPKSEQPKAEQPAESVSATHSLTQTPRRPTAITDGTWQDLEDVLIAADFGPDLAEELVAELRQGAAKFRTSEVEDLQRMLRESLEERLAKFEPTLNLTDRPAVVLVVGVNGVGKTTTIGKFAKFLAGYDKKVLIGAADTFRAAAVEQLATWADRAGADIVRPEREGQDPASVAFQAVQRAIDGSYDVVLIDTAGRLQTKSGLMDELGKIRRVVEKLAPIAEVLLVLDATTGQNGLAQADAFVEVAQVTGLVLTKLDGSAKGGFVVNVQQQTGIPVKLIGQGEGIADLTGFTPHVFVRGLVES